MEDLKRCPFCGGEAKKVTDIVASTRLNKYYCVRCTSCFCQSASYQEGWFRLAIDAWNRRAENADCD